MPKNSIKQIEKDEHKILEELRKNANKSINDIAKTCGFSRQKVWRVIKNLEKNKIIWGYTAVIDYEKLNKKRFVLLMKRSNKPITDKLLNQVFSREVKEKAKKMGVEYVDSIYINGVYDWILTFFADDIRIAKNLVELYNKSYGDIFTDIQLSEEMFMVQKCGIDNPEIKKIKDFFKI